MTTARIGIYLGLFIAWSGCTAPADSAAGTTAAATAASGTLVYGEVDLVPLQVRRGQPLLDEPVALAKASPILRDGQPVAFAGGLPVTACGDAEALAIATSDDAGRFEFPAVSPGDYCVRARGHEVDFHLDGSSPNRGVDDLVIDLNTYSTVCALNDPTQGPDPTCSADRDFVGASCSCQVAMNVYAAGTIVGEP